MFFSYFKFGIFLFYLVMDDLKKVMKDVIEVNYIEEVMKLIYEVVGYGYSNVISKDEV